MYARVFNGEVLSYPYTMEHLYADHPNTTFPQNWTDELLALAGMVRVVVTGAPEHDRSTQIAEQIGCAYNAEKGRWEQSWTIRAKTADEKAAGDAAKSDEVRSARNNRLTRSDWTQVLDAQVDRAAWATYRQALRDITAQPGFPWEVTWPQEP